MNREARGLLFDMDGILIDSEPIWRRAEVEIFADVGVVLSERDCFETQGLRIDDAVAYWFARTPWSGRSCESVADAIVDRVAALIRAEGTPLAAVHESIDAAKKRGWRLGLASSSSQFLIDTVLDHFELRDAFEVTRSAENEDFGKPHPAVYLSTAGALQIDPRRCVAVEDSVNGVISALAAQMACIAIPAPESREDPRFAIASRRLTSLESLSAALEDFD
jgi:mannitol-1-/sugar-/sorbitol-6-/2-deoxyglucose-6-phosphatase